MICTKCGQIYEFENDRMETLQHQIASSHGFHMLQHKMEIYGICNRCLKDRVKEMPLRSARQGDRLTISGFIGGAGARIRLMSMGLRIGDFVLLTFPGELSVQIGLNIKKASPHDLTYVAAYSNGYVYYAPTAEQLRNVGGAQEDSECLLAPQWQKLYEDKAAEMLRKL